MLLRSSFRRTRRPRWIPRRWPVFSRKALRSDEVVFTVSRPVLPANGTLELAEKNPGGLRLMIGGRTAKGVGESHLMAGSDDIWKKIGKKLKDLTSLGVLVVHPETGETSPARGFRFTSGAKALDANGVAMLSSTGLRLTMIEHDGDKGTHSEKP